MRRLGRSEVLFALVALAGCGGSSSASSTAAPGSAHFATTSGSATMTPAPAGLRGSSLKLAADPGGRLKFNTRVLRADPGQVTIDLANASPLPHNVTVASRSGTVLGATPTFRGGTGALTLNLGPGTYVFYCSVPGHREVGMQGTLVVK